MTALQYRVAIRKLGLSITKAGPFFSTTSRNSRRWAKDGPPDLVAKFLRVMIEHGLMPKDIS